MQHRYIKRCIEFYRVLHELMHSVGFHHEHSRPDRDKYITINWKNIDKDKKNNFLKKKLDQVNLIGEYDICSVLHYDISVFVKEDLLKVRSIFQFIVYSPA